MRLEDAAHGYKIFNDKLDNCEKIVLAAYRAGRVLRKGHLTVTLSVVRALSTVPLRS